MKTRMFKMNLIMLNENCSNWDIPYPFQVLESCVSCLGAVVNRVSHNYSLVKDLFQKFFGKF